MGGKFRAERENAFLAGRERLSALKRFEDVTAREQRLRSDHRCCSQ